METVLAMCCFANLVVWMLEEEGDGLVYLGEEGEESLTVDRQGGGAQLVLQLLIVL